ncbi:MAG TPA: NAD(P)-dependent oxidoreductase [Myxococcales bacterium]|nr:NAD(P)-dependent oxidoreductase [Myxococcales bacterium]
MTSMLEGPFLVTGASGQLGRLVLDRLLDQGAQSVIATTRTPENLAAYAERGVEVRRADFNEPDSLKEAFAGARRMLLISTSDLEPGKRLESHLVAIDAAAAAGVEHIVYTSLTNPREDSPITFAGDHKGTEEKLAACGIPHTILRNNLYMDLLLMSGPQAIGAGKLFAAAADGKVGYVTRADCAAAAAAALLHEKSSATYDVTGPGLVSMHDVAALLSSLTDKTIPYIPISASELEAAMVEHGMPAIMAKLLASIDEGIAAGHLAVSSPTVHDLTGSQPMSAEEFLRANSAALAGEQ